MIIYARGEGLLLWHAVDFVNDIEVPPYGIPWFMKTLCKNRIEAEGIMRDVAMDQPRCMFCDTELREREAGELAFICLYCGEAIDGKVDEHKCEDSDDGNNREHATSQV